jgi:hypothetical protein
MKVRITALITDEILKPSRDVNSFETQIGISEASCNQVITHPIFKKLAIVIVATNKNVVI